MKTQRFVEDVAKDNEYDTKELLNASFKYPIKHWILIKYTTTKALISLKLSDLLFNVKLFLGVYK